MDAHLDTLTRTGVVKLPQALPRDLVSAAQTAFFNSMTRRGWYQDGQWLTDTFPDLAWPEPGAKMVEGLKREPSFEALSATIDPFIGKLSAIPLKVMPPGAQLLFTAPNAAQWHLPAKIWHLDLPRIASGTVGLQAFTFLSSVAPGGGGTLVAAGSHRFLNDVDLPSKKVKPALKRHAWFRELLEGEPGRIHLEASECEGIPVGVVELTGEPGDVWIMDMRCLHTVAPNATAHPRVMLTRRYASTDTLARLAPKTAA